MSQISPPIRVLLAASIVLLAAWFTVLKPGGAADQVATPAPVPTTVPAKDPAAKANTSLGKAVQKAESAKQQTEAAQAKASAEAPAAASSASASSGSHAATAKASAAKPAASGAAAKAKPKAHANTTGLPLPVGRAVAARKVLVLLFWNPKAADDRAVRKAVAGVDRHHGKVFLKVANVKDIAQYAAITRGVEVQQSPSVVVVDRKLRGDLLTGYVDRVTIDQAVSDALRAR